jgi:hypothetical protein
VASDWLDGLDRAARTTTIGKTVAELRFCRRGATSLSAAVPTRQSSTSNMWMMLLTCANEVSMTSIAAFVSRRTNLSPFT